jgi:hypothetical protein
MASQSHDEEADRIIKVIRRLVADGTAFSVSVLEPDDPRIKQVQSRGTHERFTGDADCTQWVYVPGTGYVCVQHGKSP